MSHEMTSTEQADRARTQIKSIALAQIESPALRAQVADLLVTADDTLDAGKRAEHIVNRARAEAAYALPAGPGRDQALVEADREHEQVVSRLWRAYHAQCDAAWRLAPL